jgi:tetratricopeptide (TPR) repeat protein
VAKIARLTAAFLFFCSRSAAADLEECRKLFMSGKYTECVKLAEEAIQDRGRDEEWPILLTKSLLTLGRYPEAQVAVSNALQRYRWSIRLSLLGREVFTCNGRLDRARALLDEINEMGGARTSAYRDPPTLVALGKAALLLKADPKLVLENFFDQARKIDPDFREAYLASGELALEKHDYELAAKTFREALKKFPEDPDVHFGLARAYEPSARPLMIKSIETALRYNTNHPGAQLLLADHLVDGEEYTAAQKTLDSVLAVNPSHPEAWAYRSVLAHLANDAKGEASAREKALRFWTNNSGVDHLIGQKLSQKYRFAEGSARQRQALQFDPRFLPARIQLAQDLLRLGEEVEGWRLAQEVHQQDGYDVTAYNLVTLQESLTRFKTISNEHFVVRMSPHEAAVYGDRVLALLHRARTNLSQKYGWQQERPTIVEIFPKQGDFAVRTFGMPHNPGFLGVCFGSVITANSPASQAGHASNWEAVLWHEFCHVITLQLTRNKMPRWLSEGISVYEERQANPVWGQHMNPRYREMISGEDLTPVSELSAAFLAPESDLHLQFAYYESSLVVEFLIERFGLDSLKRILRDLGEGREINEAVAAHTAPREKIERDFATFAHELAAKLAPGLDWEKPKDPSALASERPAMRKRYGLGPVDTDSLSRTNRSTPPPPSHLAVESSKSAASSTNFWLLIQRAKTALAERKWEEAKAPLKKVIEYYPAHAGSDSAYALLAAAHRGLNETNEERLALTKLAELDADNTDVFLRLMELDETAGDWPGVTENAERFLAVNPLLPRPYRYLAHASEELGQAEPAIRAYERLLLLDPPDPAEVHFRLARLLHQKGDAPGSKRNVLQALEEAPRFRDAQRLLLEIANGPPANKDNGNAQEAKP